MTAAEWGALIPSIVGLATALTAFIRINTVSKKVQAHLDTQHTEYVSNKK